MLYAKKVFQHFQNPKNMGEIKNPDAMAQVGNPVYGDIMKIYLKIQKTKNKKQKTTEYIKDIKFQTLGCAAAIATSSIATEMVKGKSLTAAKKLSKSDIVKKLGGLPPNKLHCSLLAVEALQKAIEEYENKNNRRKNKHK